MFANTLRLFASPVHVFTGIIELLMISYNHDAMHNSYFDIACSDRPVSNQDYVSTVGNTIDLAMSDESPGQR